MTSLRRMDYLRRRDASLPFRPLMAADQRPSTLLLAPGDIVAGGYTKTLDRDQAESLDK